MPFRDMTREGRIKIVKEMIEKEIEIGGSLKSLKEKIEKRWPSQEDELTVEQSCRINREGRRANRELNKMLKETRKSTRLTAEDYNITVF